MSHIVDKRFTIKDGHVVNRQKFIDRYKAKIKDAIKKTLSGESIKDFKFKDKKIKIKTDGGIDLPSLDYDYEEGVYDSVAVGNKTFKKGDKVKKPIKGSSSQGSDSGGGKDEFEFMLTEQEFADLFFEDLELPDLVKKQFTGDVYEIQRAGYSNTGGPSSLSVRQTIIRAYMRRYALKKQDDKKDDKLILDGEKIVLKPKKKISFLEDTDLRYNHRDRVDVPASKAVMFCLMDISGSMGETEKDIAKRFFLLLSMFLQKNYDIVDIVFVRHAEWAEECTEEVFFHGKESGGTVISTGYAKILEIIQARYKVDSWNIYIAQASDGDNFEYDNANMTQLLTQHMLPLVQYFAYIEIKSGMFSEDKPSELYQVFEKICGTTKNLSIRIIKDYKEIFEVFRSLFKKRK